MQRAIAQEAEFEARSILLANPSSSGDIDYIGLSPCASTRRPWFACWGERVFPSANGVSVPALQANSHCASVGKHSPVFAQNS